MLSTYQYEFYTETVYVEASVFLFFYYKWFFPCSPLYVKIGMVCPHKLKRAALCSLYEFTTLTNQSHPLTVKHSAHIKLSFSTGTFSKIIFMYQRSHLHQHFLIAVSVYSGYACWLCRSLLGQKGPDHSEKPVKLKDVEINCCTGVFPGWCVVHYSKCKCYLESVTLQRVFSKHSYREWLYLYFHRLSLIMKKLQFWACG